MDNITEIIIINPESDNSIENIDQVENTIDENSSQCNKSIESIECIELSSNNASSNKTSSDENQNYVLTNHIIYKVIMYHLSLFANIFAHISTSDTKDILLNKLHENTLDNPITIIVCMRNSNKNIDVELKQYNITIISKSNIFTLCVLKYNALDYYIKIIKYDIIKKIPHYMLPINNLMLDITNNNIIARRL